MPRPCPLSKKKTNVVRGGSLGDSSSCDQSSDLESSTNVERLSPRRCSTFQTVSSQESSTVQKRVTRLSQIDVEPKEQDQTERRVLRESNSRSMRNTLETNNENRRNIIPADPPVRRPRKQRTPARRQARLLKEIETLQKRTETPLIPRLPFSRLVRELLVKDASLVTHITAVALQALQEAAEMYLTQRLEDAYLLTLHRGRVTLEARDMQLLNFLKCYINNLN